MAKKRFNVELTGDKILLHSPSGMVSTNGASRGKYIPNPEEEAKAGLYWMPDKSSIGFPSMNILGSLIAASAQYKINKKAISGFVAGSVSIEEEMVSFGTTQYEIDTRRAVVQRQGILRSRPLLRNFKLNFTIAVDDDAPSALPGLLPEILGEAGRRIGIGDFRPAKKGPFGKFIVTKFEPI